jgi:hypothetical protein
MLPLAAEPKWEVDSIRVLPGDADRQVREDGFFREMRISRSGKLRSFLTVDGLGSRSN